MRERDIQAALIERWRYLGVPGTLVAAIPNANAHGQPGLTPGLPDLMVVTPKIGVGFIELKTLKGRVSPAQAAMRATLEALKIPYALTRDIDEPVRVLEDWGAIRQARHGRNRSDDPQGMPTGAQTVG